VKDLRALDRFRARSLEHRLCDGSNPDPSKFGIFLVPGDGLTLHLLVSSAEGWDHVSVSTKIRTPFWREMEKVKRLFFEDHEDAMQLHVPESDHINCHPFCLHIWRPHDRTIPRPPAIMVGL
jgi:hypothetical protein